MRYDLLAPNLRIDLFQQAFRLCVGSIDLDDLANLRFSSLQVAGLEKLLAVRQQIGNLGLLQPPPNRFQLQKYFFHVLVTSVSFLRQHAFHDRLHVRGRAMSSLGQGSRLFEDDVGHQGRGIVPFEGPAVGQQFVKHHACSPDIGTRVGSPVAEQLRGHVAQGTYQHACRLRACTFAQPGDAKVHHNYRALDGDHHVARLDVAVYYGRILLVSIFESPANVDDEANLLREWQVWTAIEDFVEAFAGQKLHGDEGSVPFVAQLVDGDDVGMLKAASRTRFRVEALQKIGVVGKTGSECFEGDNAVNEGVAGLIDDTHGALADLLNDFEFAELPHRCRSTPLPRQANPSEIGEQF